MGLGLKIFIWIVMFNWVAWVNKHIYKSHDCDFTFGLLENLGVFIV